MHKKYLFRHILVNHLSYKNLNSQWFFSQSRSFCCLLWSPTCFHRFFSFLFLLVATKTQNSFAGGTKSISSQNGELIWLNSTILWDLHFKNYRNVSGLAFNIYEFLRMLFWLFQLLTISLWKWRLFPRIAKVQH